jgi:N-sulfoglucosamine sulfohydrolase
VGYTGKGVAPVVVTEGRLLTGKAWNAITLTPPGKEISNVDYSANFRRFLEERAEGQPFCFWFGALEPHRRYEYGISARVGGKQPSDIHAVPAFWPDSETVRTDMLDYAFEIEYYDQHLQAMLEILEEQGELDNTLIIVTSDNGMPFPRAKGIQYEYSNHLPLAIMWPAGIQSPGRIIDDYVSFVDFAPTILDAAGTGSAEELGMQPVQGRSLRPIFESNASGRVEPGRDHVLMGQERHDVGRPDDVGFPVRSILRDGMLYIHNFAPDRWPMGDPVTGYLNTDGSPTKTAVLELMRQGMDRRYWELCFGKSRLRSSTTSPSIPNASTTWRNCRNMPH